MIPGGHLTIQEVGLISPHSLGLVDSVLIKTRTNICNGITTHALWRLHGEQEVNTESHRVLFTCQLRCHVHVLPNRCRGFGGHGQILPFIIKHILGIKHIFPCRFGMRLLTCVYGILTLLPLGTAVCVQMFEGSPILALISSTIVHDHTYTGLSLVS